MDNSANAIPEIQTANENAVGGHTDVFDTANGLIQRKAAGGHNGDVFFYPMDTYGPGFWFYTNDPINNGGIFGGLAGTAVQGWNPTTGVLPDHPCIAAAGDATLTITKNVAGGNAAADDFDLQYSKDGGGWVDALSGVSVTVAAGNYEVREATLVTGYTAGSWQCTLANAPGGGVVYDETFWLFPGDNVSCTITNTYAGPTTAELSVNKIVVNDNGGTAVDSDWTIELYDSGSNFVASGAADVTFSNLAPGAYVVKETGGPAGYTAGSWGGACTDVQGDGTVTLAAGNSLTCTIYNYDDAPSLELVKSVTNDDGGAAQPSDWTLTATGPTGFSGAGPIALSPAGFDAGTYDLSETGPAGYTASAWVCVGGTQVDGDTVTLALGESAVCTITNDDQASSLTLEKVVVNDDGGNAQASDWTLTATGPTGFSGVGPTVNSPASFDAGTYDLSETGPAGYTASAWVCTGGTQVDADTVTVSPGDAVTCTVTNDDDPPTTATLTVIKTVINDDGGTLGIGDFDLFVNSTQVTSSVTNTFPAGAQGTMYTVSETNQPGYAATIGGQCNPDGTITLVAGQDYTCTISNDDQGPVLELVKVVVNDDGGIAQPSDWTLTATGPTGFSGAGPTVLSPAGFDAGTYDLSETGPAGYAASAWVCRGGTQVDADTVTLALGELAVCTITNDDIAPPPPPPPPPPTTTTTTTTPPPPPPPPPTTTSTTTTTTLPPTTTTTEVLPPEPTTTTTEVLPPEPTTTTTTEATTTTEETTTTTQASEPTPPDELPYTGTDTPLQVVILGGLGLALLGAGLLTVAYQRRRWEH
jgi:hypothetical protein